MTDTEKCEFCGGGGARRYTVTSHGDAHTVFVCDSCRRRFFVTTDEAHEVLRMWASERTEVDE